MTSGDSGTPMSRLSKPTLTCLPIELLAEILLFTCSPPTVLAVSRTCSYLHRTLAQNAAAAFIWRRVRETCKPLPLPNPGTVWKGTEAQYAAFVFDGGRCEICRKNTRAMYVSFSLRIRLCGSCRCMKKFKDEHLIDATAALRELNCDSIWIPHVESDESFRFRPPTLQTTWPDNRTFLLRKADWYNHCRDILLYVASKRNDMDSRQRGDHERELINSALERRQASLEGFSQMMSLSVELLTWKIAYDKEHRRIKRANESWSEALAAKEGWINKDLLISDAYHSLLTSKNFLLEQIETKDVTALIPAIESQLLERQAHRDRQKAEKIYAAKLTEARKLYDSMRCGTLDEINGGISGLPDFGNRMVFPSFHVFCDLPSVRTFKGSPDPSLLPPRGIRAAPSDLRSSPLAISLIISDIQMWLIPVKSYFMGLLGHPDKWQSASKRKIHPLERVTARFLCRRCRGGGVGQHQREGCLDLKGVCAHTCTSTKLKITEGRRQETRKDDVNEHTDGRDEYAPAGKGSKKKHKERTYDWRVDVFEKDEKAVRFINGVLELLGLSDEDSETASVLDKLGARILCKSCTGWIVMDFDTAIGHAHRHDNMDFDILSTDLVPEAMPATDYPMRAFERGLAMGMLGHRYGRKKLSGKVNYGCKHCRTVGVKAMNFNALRSHAKAKHGIQDARDEDIFTCSTS